VSGLMVVLRCKKKNAAPHPRNGNPIHSTLKALREFACDRAVFMRCRTHGGGNPVHSIFEKCGMNPKCGSDRVYGMDRPCLCRYRALMWGAAETLPI